jgi:hypothetical protein
MKKLFIFILMMVCFSSALWAHEKRAVGNYEFVVGFVNEPAFAGSTNALDLRISKNGQPVEGLEKTLKATARYGSMSRSMDLTLKPRHKQPGAYAGYFFPTKPGQYSFQIIGEIEGQKINETFEPHPMQDTQPLRFP